jgi:hypothetical protein
LIDIFATVSLLASNAGLASNVREIHFIIDVHSYHVSRRHIKYSHLIVDALLNMTRLDTLLISCSIFSDATEQNRFVDGVRAGRIPLKSIDIQTGLPSNDLLTPGLKSILWRLPFKGEILMN